ncbi:MAG: hypothetical protein DRJ05_17025 [Bacteroidetes bacterium]|nr:MAG: hypothetical protein DRJ05_17025 [Bacteroidota bacterium]
MKPKLQIFTLILLLTQTALAQIITVKQDSTGDYAIIQDAINASNHGDTVLVWPGTYFENVDFAGKNITLASQMITTTDPAFKFNTIIDGNHNGTCVLINSDETDAVLNGFTIQNGSGYDEYQDEDSHGGGIFVNRADCKIFNCVIKNNFANISGGGIYCAFDCNMFLSRNSIFNNHCYVAAGGVLLGLSTISFDSVNRNSIYSNYSSRGNDFLKNTEDTVRLFLDTCTVLNPDSYFLYSVGDEGYHKSDIITNIYNALLTPVDSNLFVNPETGNNSNNGLSPEEPLKTIAFAYSKIAVDSLKKNTIYLADGIYSDTMNSEKFPLNVRPFINVEGNSRNGTILDGEYKSMLLRGNHEVSEYSFSKMTLRRGTYVNFNNHFYDYAGLIEAYLKNDNICFDSVKFMQGRAKGADGGVGILGSNHTVFNNCEISNHVGGAAMRISMWNKYDTCFINNCKFISNKPDTNDPEIIKPGRGLKISGSNSVGIVTNSLFVDNDWQAFLSSNTPNSYLINCTFVDNSHWDEKNVFSLNGSSNWIYNCIVYDNAANKNFTLINSEHLINTTLHISHSLIEGGEESIEFHSSCDDDCFYFYDETNIDTDPFFLNKWEHPYQIADGSPCIDAGTLARLPDFIQLPETDLAGNPRIIGDSIDMGAYEWNPTVGIDKYQYQPIQNDKPKLLQAAPNPFSYETNISAKWDIIGHVQIEIYNNAGLRVKVIKSGKSGGLGAIKTKWNGKDESNNILPTGIYHIVMFWDGKEVDGIKVVKW